MQLLYYAIKYKGEYTKIKQAIEKNEPYEKINYSKNYVTIEDKHYPFQLKQLENPPFVLFYKGDLSLLNQKLICVIGARECSEEGKKLVQRLCQYPFVFISGLAKGIDGCVHECAKKSIGVIGCGIDVVYPKENNLQYAKTDLIISEYPDNTLPLSHHFPMRNRIMIALCTAVIVVEGKIQSGTMNSVLQALNLGKEIYTFPKSYFSEYTLNNLLIKEGANIIQDISEIVLEL